jgi:nucleoside-triphosphatase THEP1
LTAPIARPRKTGTGQDRWRLDGREVKEENNVARWALIAGPKQSNKTEWALALASALQQAEVGVGGFVQVTRRDDRGRRRHDLVRLGSDQRAPLAVEAVTAAPEEGVTFCSVVFDPEVFALGQRWLEEDLWRSRVLILGDISKVEVGGEGHSASIRRALVQPEEVIVVLLVRADQLFYIVEKFGLDETSLVSSLELPASESECEEFVEKLLEAAVGGASASEGS